MVAASQFFYFVAFKKINLVKIHPQMSCRPNGLCVGTLQSTLSKVVSFKQRKTLHRYRKSLKVDHPG